MVEPIQNGRRCDRRMLGHFLFAICFLACLLSAEAVDETYRCHQPGPIKGDCNSAVPSWFHDASKGACVPFSYSGCHGNANRFSSHSACESLCKGVTIRLPNLRPGACLSFPSLPLPTPWGFCTHMCAHFDDASCPTGQKCCFNGCGFQCVHPGAGVWARKAGRCPTGSRRGSLTPCMSDISCDGREKCCGEEGESVCSMPMKDVDDRLEEQTTTSTTSTTRATTTSSPPGDVICPLIAYRSCDGVSSKDLCFTDSDCSAAPATKCCFDGCRRSCLEGYFVPRSGASSSSPAPSTTGSGTRQNPNDLSPYKIFGWCPYPPKCPHSGRPFFRCSLDSECGFKEKCCFTGCGYECAAPQLPDFLLRSTMRPKTKTTQKITTTPTTTTKKTTTAKNTATTKPTKTTTTTNYSPSITTKPTKATTTTSKPTTTKTTQTSPKTTTKPTTMTTKPTTTKTTTNSVPKITTSSAATMTTSPASTTTTKPSSTSSSTSEDSLSSLIKPGFCRRKRDRCNGHGGPSDGATFFYLACKDDTHCFGDRKCCFDGCGYACQRPVGDLAQAGRVVRKEGSCPARTASNAPVRLCSLDGDCGGREKCCETMAGRECLEPRGFGGADEPLGELVGRSIDPDWAQRGALDAWGMGHAHCRIEGVGAKGLLYLFDAPFGPSAKGAPWSVHSRVMLRDLPVKVGGFVGERTPFDLELLDASNAASGCLAATPLKTASGGALGRVFADRVGNVDGATPPVFDDVTLMDGHEGNSFKTNVVGRVVAVTVPGSRQRLGCCRIEQCRHACCQGPVAGRCRALVPRFYYNWVSGKCFKFFYGGCDGQKNNFQTEMECLKKCRGYKP